MKSHSTLVSFARNYKCDLKVRLHQYIIRFKSHNRTFFSFPFYYQLPTLAVFLPQNFQLTFKVKRSPTFMCGLGGICSEEFKGFPALLLLFYGSAEMDENYVGITCEDLLKLSLKSSQ